MDIHSVYWWIVGEKLQRPEISDGNTTTVDIHSVYWWTVGEKLQRPEISDGNTTTVDIHSVYWWTVGEKPQRLEVSDGNTTSVDVLAVHVDRLLSRRGVIDDKLQNGLQWISTVEFHLVKAFPSKILQCDSSVLSATINDLPLM